MNDLARFVRGGAPVATLGRDVGIVVAGPTGWLTAKGRYVRPGPDRNGVNWKLRRWRSESTVANRVRADGRGGLMLLAALDWHRSSFVLFAWLPVCSRLAVLFASNIVRMAFYLIMSLGAPRACFSGRCRVRRGDANDDLCRRHARAADLRRDADGPGPFFDQDIGGRLDSAAGVGGWCSCCWSWWRRVPTWASRTPDRSFEPIESNRHEHADGLGSVGRPGRQTGAGAPNRCARHVGLPASLYPYSIHLLVVLIGAAYMARAKARADRRFPAEAASYESHVVIGTVTVSHLHAGRGCMFVSGASAWPPSGTRWAC
jgi:NADH-quinone oxidoreductase subunit J